MTFKRANLVQIAKMELIRRGAGPTFLGEKISWALGVSWPFKHANLVQIAGRLGAYFLKAVADFFGYLDLLNPWRRFSSVFQGKILF